MNNENLDQTPRVGQLHCIICNGVRPFTTEALRGYIEDDSSWPRCCKIRMAILFAPPALAVPE